MNSDRKLLKDYIVVNNIISKENCNKIINHVDNQDWHKHTWFTNSDKSSSSYDDKELLVQNSDKKIQDLMVSIILESYKKYCENVKHKNLCTKFSQVRFNKYDKGSMMRPHYDHIQSLFEGENRGIPILSFVGILNDNFEGGQFIINDWHMYLKTGDVLIFPSNFLYEHEVKEIKSGTRYSFVSWGF